jgi:hypothetical protein
MDAKIDQIRQAERAADSYTLPDMEHAALAGPRLPGPGPRRSLWGVNVAHAVAFW